MAKVTISEMSKKEQLNLTDGITPREQHIIYQLAAVIELEDETNKNMREMFGDDMEITLTDQTRKIREKPEVLEAFRKLINLKNNAQNRKQNKKTSGDNRSTNKKCN